MSVSILLMFISFLAIALSISKSHSIDIKIKNQIAEKINLYLISDEKFKSEVPEGIDIKFDKKSDIYIVTVTFENTPKKMHVFVSKDELF